jgi:hypothetical protein
MTLTHAAGEESVERCYLGIVVEAGPILIVEDFEDKISHKYSETGKMICVNTGGFYVYLFENTLDQKDGPLVIDRNLVFKSYGKYEFFNGDYQSKYESINNMINLLNENLKST